MTDPLHILREHLDEIDRDVEPVVRRHRDQIQCAKGCSDCCHQTFTVSEIEGRMLRRGLAELDEPTRRDILERARRYRADAKEPCPVLDEHGACRLYEHRPRICRKYGIPLWHPDRPEQVRCCPKNFRDTRDLDPDLIVEPQARWAEQWIVLRSRLGLGPARNATIAEHLVAVEDDAERHGR